jgi:hypothetical protein
MGLLRLAQKNTKKKEITMSDRQEQQIEDS